MEQGLQHEDGIVLEKSAPAPGDKAPALAEAGPWRRWFARLFDLWWEILVVAVTGGVVIGLIWPAFLIWIETPLGSKMATLACVPLALLLDAGVTAALGNTPGKALLGLRVGLAEGGTPGFVQLCRRNLGVWIAGLGLGLALISLLTMARQLRRLKNGGQASYDDEEFRVRARPIGWARRAGFCAAFLGLFVLMASLETWNREDLSETAARNAGPSFQWTNPGTGRTVSVAPQWSYRETESDDGVALHQFTQYSEHAVVILSSEDADGSTLPQYARNWIGSVADTFRVQPGSFAAFRGQPAWSAAGKHRDQAMGVRVRVVQADGKLWRLIVVQSDPAAYTDDLVDVLAGRLWDSVLSAP
jgi:uncharacterized RDD family membrane protein YckC